MNYAVKLLQQRRDELTDGIWSIDEQRRNIENLREGVDRAESNLSESELELEQIIAALGSLEVSA